MIPGERLVVVLVMNVEPENVGGNFFGAKIIRQFSHALLGKVAVAALIVAQCPARRQRRATGERGVTFDDRLWLRTVDEIIIRIAAVRAERQQILTFVADVEGTAPRVVEKDAVRATA